VTRLSPFISQFAVLRLLIMPFVIEFRMIKMTLAEATMLASVKNKPNA